MKRLTTRLCILLLASLPTLHAYDFIDEFPAWPDGTVTLELQLGSSPVYSDGTTPNGTAIQAIAQWNPSMERVQLKYVNNSGAAKSKTNGKNNVFFNANVYGSAFGSGVLAVTVGRTNNSAPIEMDVVVNSARQWDSYRGYLQYAKIDLRRVLAHEFGHVLGLDHPDEVGQWITALMNSSVSDIDSVQQDDMDGASVRYGRGPGNPAVAPVVSEHPQNVNTTEGYAIIMWGAATGSAPISYQWLKDGVQIPGANENWLTFDQVRTSDAGKYQIRFSNEAGSVLSNEATLTVTPATIPVFQQQPPTSHTLETGATLYLYGYATSNVSIEYQWTRDDVPIANATSNSLNLQNVTVEQAGTYRLVATNVAGSATSNGCVVTVTPATLPVISTQPRDSSVILGQSAWFSCYANSSSPVTFQWTKDGVDIPNATSSSLSLSTITAADAGTYRARVTNIAGSVTTEPAVLTVLPVPPPSEIQLSNTTVAFGSSLTFHLWSATPTTYQWYKDGVLIPGWTSDYVSKYPVTYDDAGEYFVVASNPGGSTTSTTALVRVTGNSATPVGGWVRSVVHGGIVYFLFENPARIERFDMNSETWLAPVKLNRTPIAMAISGGDAIISSHLTLYRVNLATALETALTTLEHVPVHLVVHGDYVYIEAQEPFGSSTRRIGNVNLTGSPASVTWLPSNYNVGSGFSIDAAGNRLVAPKSWSGGIVSYQLLPGGAFGEFSESPYVSGSSTAQRTFARPDGTAVLTDVGTAYDPSTLAEIARFTLQIEKVAFLGSRSLMLRGSTVTCVDADFREMGDLVLKRAAQEIAVYNDQVFTFSQPAGGAGTTITWERNSLTSLALPEPVPALSPADLNFTVENTFLDRNGVLLIYSRLHGNIFRWSTTEQRFLDTIPLRGRPNAIAYSPELNRLYLGYGDGRIRRIDLTTSFAEEPFMSGNYSVATLTAAGEHLIIAFGSSYYNGALWIVDSSGRTTAMTDHSYFSRSTAWNESRKRVYHFQDGLSPNDLNYTEIRADGTFGPQKGSPYHGEITIAGPIRLSPNGETLLLGSGLFFNVDTLVQNNALSEAIIDACWLGQTLFTIRTTLDGTRIERRAGPNYGTDASVLLQGNATRLFPCATNRLLAVTIKRNRLLLTLLDADLTVQNHFEEAPDLTRVVLANLSTRAEVGTGDNVVIAGFVVSGSGDKRVLLRAVGPGLDRFGVSGTLDDPVLSLVGDNGEIATNDNWSSSDVESLKSAFKEVFAFSIPEDSLDAALVTTLRPGKYTALVSGKNGTQGVALVEAYDLDADPGERRLINISTRAVVGIGDKVLIPGLVVEGTESKRLLIRAAGPALARFGVAGVLADPRLEVIDDDDILIAANDNWGDDNTEVTQAATTAASAFRLAEGSRDAALVATLPPGSYTVVVRGVGDTTGVALVEVYEVP